MTAKKEREQEKEKTRKSKLERSLQVTLLRHLWCMSSNYKRDRLTFVCLTSHQRHEEEKVVHLHVDTVFRKEDKKEEKKSHVSHRDLSGYSLHFQWNDHEANHESLFKAIMMSHHETIAFFTSRSGNRRWLTCCFSKRSLLSMWSGNEKTQMQQKSEKKRVSEMILVS